MMRSTKEVTVGGSQLLPRCGLIVVLMFAAGVVRADEEPSEADKVLASIKWTEGPAKVSIADYGELEIPEGMRYTAADGARKMLELMQNPADGSDLGMLTTDELSWFMTFNFNDIGYVKDAEKEKLDADDILDSIREGNESGNEERKKRGWAPITITGWHTAPFYNKDTNNLEWCIKGESEGRTIINYNTRILGRHGVMSANLLVAPDKLEATLPTVKKLLSSYSFKQGQRYAEWKSGDKIAQYGLTALVVGGAVGVAAKVGLLAKLGKLWKVIILGLIGLAGALKRLIFRQKAPPPAPPPPAPPADPAATG